MTGLETPWIDMPVFYYSMLLSEADIIDMIKTMEIYSFKCHLAKSSLGLGNDFLKCK